MNADAEGPAIDELDQVDAGPLVHRLLVQIEEGDTCDQQREDFELLHKPVDSERLLALIHKMLGEKHHDAV